MLAHFLLWRTFIGTALSVLNYISGCVTVPCSYMIWKRHVLRFSTENFHRVYYGCNGSNGKRRETGEEVGVKVNQNYSTTVAVSRKS